MCTVLWCNWVENTPESLKNCLSCLCHMSACQVLAHSPHCFYVWLNLLLSSKRCGHSLLTFGYSCKSGLRGLSFPFQKGQEHCAHMTFKQRCKPITSSFLEDFVLIIVLEFVATMQSCCRSTSRKWGGTWQVPAFSSGLYSGIL